jgi:hypothetical protein
MGHRIEILDLKWFRIISYVFDGDSCFTILHSELQQHWNIEIFEEAMPNMIFNTRARRRIITEPLHVLKRIHYRFLSGPFRIGVGHDQTEFCIGDVRDKLPLPPIVFDNSRITKMHDSLTLELVSQASLHQIFNNCMPLAFLAFFPWFLLVAGLTNWNFSTKTRCDIFETVFWLLYFYRINLTRYPHPSDTTQRIPPNKYAFLYITDELRRALSTFYIFIACRGIHHVQYASIASVQTLLNTCLEKRD